MGAVVVCFSSQEDAGHIDEDGILVASEKAGTLEIVVNKSYGSRLGITGSKAKKGILLTAVEEGLLAAWNCQHGNCCPILPGDVIVQVNGVGGDYDLMSGELDKADILTIRVQRQTQGTQDTPKVLEEFSKILEESGKIVEKPGTKRAMHRIPRLMAAAYQTSQVANLVDPGSRPVC